MMERRPDNRTPYREPSLSEMLDDPVVQAVMSVDGVRPVELVTLLREARERLDAAGTAR
ncbi:MAG: hypothetical protein AB7S71_16235 [Dongiaceae bacterium]